MKSAAFSPEWLQSRLTDLLPEYPEVPVCVALSGGLDSVVLLAALAVSRRRLSRQRASAKSRRGGLRAIHINHGLSANAGSWTRYCEAIARRFRVPLDIIAVKVDRSRGVSLEAAAREARYAAFAGALKPGEVLLTAHHQDDQLETVFLQLLRGSGVAGLAAMPDVASFAAGRLARPLLTRSRFDLEEWARAQGLHWVDDDTNFDERLDRNYLRRTVLPLVRERWPGAAAAVARSARHAAEARRLLDSLALADVERAAVGASLSVQRLRALDIARRKNAIRLWITRSGHIVPDSRRLEEIAATLFKARADANPSVRWNHAVVQRHAELLTISRPDAVIDAKASVAEPEALTWEWADSSRLSLTRAGGTLEIKPDPRGPLALDALPASLTVQNRRGGERLRPRAGGPTRTLKSMLQQTRMPLSQRERLPLIFAGDRLIAVADLWLDASVQASASTSRRGRIVWRHTRS